MWANVHRVGKAGIRNRLADYHFRADKPYTARTSYWATIGEFYTELLTQIRQVILISMFYMILFTFILRMTHASCFAGLSVTFLLSKPRCFHCKCASLEFAYRERKFSKTGGLVKRRTIRQREANSKKQHLHLIV